MKPPAAHQSVKHLFARVNITRDVTVNRCHHGGCSLQCLFRIGWDWESHSQLGQKVRGGGEQVSIRPQVGRGRPDGGPA